MPIFLKTCDAFNPRSVHCPLCLEGMDEVKILIGDTRQFECNGCEFLHLGKPKDGKCVRCGCSILNDIGVPPESCSFPFSEPCGKCAKELSLISAKVTLGEFGFVCTKCRKFGTLPNPPENFRSLEVGKLLNEITEKQCPYCSDDKKRSRRNSN
jgi:hypothetical protein